MARTLPRALGLVLALSALALPLAAQKGIAEPRAGLEVKPPKGWVELPGHVDRGATLRLFSATRSLVAKDDNKHTPVMRVMFFPSGGDASKDVVDGLPRTTPFRGLEDFATRGFGAKDLKKEAGKAGALECTRMTGTNAGRTLHGAAFAVDGGEAALCFEVLSGSFDKMQKDFEASINAVASVARVGEAHPLPPWASDAQWATKDLQTRQATRKPWIEAVVAAASKDVGTSFKASKSKYWTVLSAADAGFTKKAVAAAEVMRAWWTTKTPDLAKDPQPAVLRIFASMDQYNAYLTTVTETREYDRDRRELHVAVDPDNGGSSGYGMLFRAVTWHLFDDVDDGILPAMPRWFDNGLWEFLRSSQCDGKKVDFSASEVEKGRMVWYGQNKQEIPKTWEFIQESIQKSPEDGKNEDVWGYTPDCARLVRWWLMHEGGKAFDRPNLFVDYVKAVGQGHARMGADPMLDVGSPHLTDDENKKRNKGQYKWRDDLLSQINTIALPLQPAQWTPVDQKWAAFNQSFK